MAVIGGFVINGVAVIVIDEKFCACLLGYFIRAVYTDNPILPCTQNECGAFNIFNLVIYIEADACHIQTLKALKFRICAMRCLSDKIFAEFFKRFFAIYSINKIVIKRVRISF